MSFLDELSYEIFCILILPGLIFYYYDSFGEDIAVFLDTWTYYIMVFQYVFIHNLNHHSLTFKKKLWGQWKEFRDYWLVCIGVFLLSWFSDWVQGAKDASSDDRILENFLARLRISTMCFVGVLATKWMLKDSRIMGILSNIADSRRQI
jgi:hypothetical protein